MGLLDNRVAIITGAGRGIGREAAILFVEQGGKVVINDLDEAPAAEAVAACDSVSPGNAIFSLGSVADPKYTDALVKSAIDKWGVLDILVNNAGVTRDRMVHRMSDDEWDLVIDVNLKGTFNCIRSAAPYLRDTSKAEIEEHGRVRYHRKVVNFYSTAAIRGNPGQMNYTAAKMGNVGMTRTLAQEWGPFQVNVNAVAPGFTDTRLTAAKEEGDGTLGIPQKLREQMIARIPFGRPASPRDVANAVLFFSCYLSDFITGQELNVSGGHQIP